jgi:hypothetical protein
LKLSDWVEAERSELVEDARYGLLEHVDFVKPYPY